MKTRAERQVDGIRSTMVYPALKDRLEVYAADNGMSVSAAIGAIIHDTVSSDVPIPRRRRTKRVTFWVSDKDEFIAFQKKAEAQGETLTSALEKAIEAAL